MRETKPPLVALADAVRATEEYTKAYPEAYAEAYAEAYHQSPDRLPAARLERALRILLVDPASNALVRSALSSVPIAENGCLTRENLVSFTKDVACFNPAPYQHLGARYGQFGPFMARVSVVDRLMAAQEILNTIQPGAQLCVFDAYRPLSVQKFMVEHSLKVELSAQGLDWASYCNDPNQAEHLAVKARVMQVWAEPNPNLDAPPPHSTGAAIDLTIKMPNGTLWDMGTPIDYLGPQSYPDFFAEAKTPAGKLAHQGRELLRHCMVEAGFKRLPHEWWHFSYGDQWWAVLSWLESSSHPSYSHPPRALYGRFELND